jgi:hypothetical protein
MEATFFLEIISIIIQFIIIFVNIRTPIMLKGTYTLQFRVVIKNYFNNGLLIDLMGILPFNCIFGRAKILDPIVLITLLRVLRVIAVAKILFLFEKFEVFLKNLNVLIIVIKAIMILFLLLHWTSCAWGFINARIES